MKKKTKKRFTKHVQLKVRTGIKSGQSCNSDADCSEQRHAIYCVDQYCVECRFDADCPENYPYCYSGWCED